MERAHVRRQARAVRRDRVVRATLMRTAALLSVDELIEAILEKRFEDTPR